MTKPKIAMLCALLILSSAAFADGPNAPINDAIGAINSIFTSISSKATSLAGQSVGIGQSLFGAIVAAVMSYEILKGLLEDTSALQSIARLVSKGIPISIIGWAINNNAENYQAIQSTFDVLTTTFAGEILRNDIGNIMNQFFQAVENLLITPDQAKSGDHGIWDGITGLMNIDVGLLLSQLIAFFFKAVAALVVLLAAVIFVGQIMISQFMLAIAAALGPIMMPFGLIPITSSLLDGWLMFMIAGGMYQVVGAIIFSLTKDILKNLSNVAQQAATAGDPIIVLVTAFAALLIATLIAYLMMQVPSLVQGLMSGRGVQLSGWNRPVTTSAGAMSESRRMTAPVAKSVSRTAYRTGAGAGRLTTSGFRAARVGANAGRLAAAVQGSGRAGTIGKMVGAAASSVSSAASSGARATTKQAGSAAATKLRNFHNNMMGQKPQSNSSGTKTKA